MNDADVLRLARERYQAGIDADHDNRTRDENDRRFYKGEQWDPADKQKRRNRISVTVNRCPQFVKQISGELFQNTPVIKVLPVDDQTDEALAEVYTAIIRHIENTSDAAGIYAKAGEQAIIGGIGWFRILNEYTGGKSFDQELVIKGVRNPLSVVVDPGAIEPIRCDMMWAFVSEMVPEDTFKAKFPKALLQGFDSGDNTLIAWKSDKKIRVAEYWTREPVEREMVLLTNGSVLWGDEIDDTVAFALQEQNIGVQATRKAETYKVKCKKITGVEVLEEFDWEGTYIPLIPVIGEEVEVGDEIFRHGLIHHARDSQKAYNFARSAMLETVASQPKAPFLITPKMVAGFEDQWAALNEGNPQALPVNPDPAVPGALPIRLAPPNFSAAWYQESLVADGDMKATTGIYDASLGKQSNETSGVAIRARDSQGETGSYVYVDHIKAAVKHCGRCLIELIPKVITGPRVFRLMGEDGALEKFLKVNTILPDGRIENDLSVGEFDLQVTTGPAFATKRQEAAERMMSLVQSVPAIGQIGADMIVKALDMPYGDKLADRLALALVPPGMDQDVDRKRAEMQANMGPPQPDPAQEMAFATGKAELDNKQADTALKAAKAQDTEIQSAIAVQQAHLDTQQAHLGAFQQGFEMAGGMGDGPETAKPGQ